MIRLRNIIMCMVGAALLLVTATAGAETMIFNTSDNQFDPGVDNQGWWSDTTAITDRLSDNYGTGISINGDHRSFFTFDLSLLDTPVINATLELRRYEYVSSAESETLGLFDVSTDAETLNDNSYISAAIYEDLGTGVSYGEFEVLSTGLSTDVLSFELNSAAVADINNAAGVWFSIGGSLLSLDGTTIGSGAESIFGSSHEGEGIQRLVVELIPEPTSMTLFSLIGIVLLKKRRN